MWTKREESGRLVIRPLKPAERSCMHFPLVELVDSPLSLPFFPPAAGVIINHALMAKKLICQKSVLMPAYNLFIALSKAFDWLLDEF